MKHSTHRLALSALALSTALFVAACGTSGASDDAGKDDQTTTTAAKADKTTTTAEETTTTEAAADEEAQARADSIDLTVSDFPDGWSSSPSTDDDSPSPLEECDPSFSDESTTLAKHSTDDFTFGSLDQNDGANLAAETKVFTDEEAAQAALDPFSDPEVVSCLDAKLKDLFGQSAGATVTGDLSEDDIDLGTDQAEGLSATYTIDAPDGSSAEVNIGLLAIRTGDLATLVTITSTGESFQPTDLQSPLTQLATLQGEA